MQVKLRKMEEGAKSKDEQIKTLRTQKEKFEGQSKVLSEQVTIIQQSHDDLLSKKAHEVDILSKEVSQVSMKERESRQVILMLENELTDVKDKLRSTTFELDTRTQENDHLISLLEDQESKMALYEQREKSI